MDIRKVIIIGSGPAGYTAGIYAARAELKPLLLAGNQPGGQLINTGLVENWPGSKSGVTGPDLMVEMRQQAEKYGTETMDKEVVKVDFSKEPFRIWTDKEEYQAKTVIIATGAKNRMLNIPGEKEFLGKGVSTCAVCDAPFYKDKIVFVVGGGDAAMEEVIALIKHVRQVKLVVRRDKLRASKIMAKKVKRNEKVEILWNTEVKAILGDQKVEGLRLLNNKTAKESQVVAEGMFLAIGHLPVTGIFKEQLQINNKGYLLTRAQQHLGDNGLLQFPTMTSREGVFAAGDVVDWRYRQAVTAAAMGCMAALDAERWLERNSE